MEIRELEEKYSRLPNEIKEARRWVCYRKSDKAPMNAINGNFAQCNNPYTWTTFRNAIYGCVKYNFDGLGFMLGNGIFGVDLDNHINENGTKEMSQDTFDKLSSEFITALNSYSERSQSGNGIHIICKGKLPDGARRKGNVEMYDSGRYFAMTGDIVNDQIIQNREEEVKVLWEKYLYTKVEQLTKTVHHEDGSVTFGTSMEEDYYIENNLTLSDEEIISKIKNSGSAVDFMRFYVNGDTFFSDRNETDHSRADMCLCMILAFWFGNNANRIDRVFRSSALMRKKWDEMRGNDTYGHLTIQSAISRTTETYNPPKERTKIPETVVYDTKAPVQANNIVTNNNVNLPNIDENGDPIIRERKRSFKNYPLDDTGNAERFYDNFGDLFRYNSDKEGFMFWDSKTWIFDSKDYVKKFADALIETMKKELHAEEQEYIKAQSEGRTETELKSMDKIIKEKKDNIKKLSNKSGKEAMITEFQHLHNVPVSSSDFDKQEMLVNTDSGIVDLTTGEIRPFEQKEMLSMNTHCAVSYNEPKTWLKFLHDIFKRKEESETQEIIDCMQMALGYSLTGRKNKEFLFILFGNGSNGKSTFVEFVRTLFGDYGKTMNSDLLMKGNTSSQSAEFALASLLGARLVTTSETSAGEKLDSTMIKKMTSGEQISAQYKYGNPFSFAPRFSPFMSTNNKPIIRDTDFGTWRRIFLIPFLNTFTEEQKDVDMPKKLAAESSDILGWIIQGSVKLHNQYHDRLPKPKCVEEATAEYKNEQDMINAFIADRCVDFPRYKTRASSLYDAFSTWAKQNNERWIMPERTFGVEMTKKHYEKRRDSTGVYYVGIKLATDTKGQIFSLKDED